MSWAPNVRGSSRKEWCTSTIVARVPGFVHRFSVFSFYPNTDVDATAVEVRYHFFF